jgi:putative transposase
MRFDFIQAEQANFTITALCRVLEVSRQGYYAHLARPVDARMAEEQAFQTLVREVFEQSHGRYGSPRVLQQLWRDGHKASKRAVEQTMKTLGLQARKPRRYRVTTQADATHAVEPNILNREFTATRPNERWVTDITYIRTDVGWSYLAAILDLFSRSVVGWALSTSLSTELPIAALQMAAKRRHLLPGLVHHSDRGCQYTSYEYRSALAEHGATVSMSRKGNCWDNAVAESFFATIKSELVHTRSWPTNVELRSAVFEYIEAFYNRRRLHSSLDYMTPSEVENLFAAQAA